jgi:hypothetical protein
METMEKWNAVSKPPKEALKTIGAGRLKGMSDIKPMWRIKKMTEVYGLCGIGWKFEVVNKFTVEVGEEWIAFADVNLYVKINGEWSDPIPGNGGSKMRTVESKGAHVSDECYKMATTDALSTAMKMIGVGADVYMGLWDGSQYLTIDPEPSTETIDESQEAEIVTLMEDVSANKVQFYKYFRIGSISQLLLSDYQKAIDMLQKKKAAK